MNDEKRTLITLDVPTLEKIRAEAWDAGHQAGMDDALYNDTTTNPHRSERHE